MSAQFDLPIVAPQLPQASTIACPRIYAPAAWMRRGLFRIMTIEQRLEQLEKSNKRLKDVLKIMALFFGVRSLPFYLNRGFGHIPSAQ